MHLEIIHLIKSKPLPLLALYETALRCHCHLKNIRNCHYLCPRKISFSFYKIQGWLYEFGWRPYSGYLSSVEEKKKRFFKYTMVARRIQKLFRRISFPLFRGKTTHTTVKKILTPSSTDGRKSSETLFL